MNISYDRESDIANISLPPDIGDSEIKEDVHVSRSRGDIYLAFDSLGKLREIEIIGASAILTSEAIDSASSM